MNRIGVTGTYFDGIIGFFVFGVFFVVALREFFVGAESCGVSDVDAAFAAVPGSFVVIGVAAGGESASEEPVDNSGGKVVVERTGAREGVSRGAGV